MSKRLVPLRDVAEFINGVAFKPTDWGDSGMPIIRIQNLTDRTKPFNRTRRAVSTRFHVQPGDLLVSWSATLGVFEWSLPETGLLNQHIFRVLPDAARVDKRYLRHGLQVAILDMQRHLHGATMQHVNRGEFLLTDLFLPPLPEQRRIADILDRAEALRAKRRAALAQLDSFTQVLFVDAFGDPLDNRKGLQTAALSCLCTRITDGTHQPPKWSATGHPFLFVSNITSGEITFDTQKFISDETHAELTRRCPIEVGDVLYSTVGSYGVPAIVRLPRKFAFQRHIAHLKPDHKVLDSQFLREMLASPPLRKQADRAARGVAQKTVNLADIKNFVVFSPPMSLQHDFARRVAAADRLKTAYRASLAKLDALVATLQHRAFQGEL